MIRADVKGKNGIFELNLPTSLNEITESYINDVTKHIKIDANYSLIGLVYREKLSTLIISSKKNKQSDISVIPIFVKAGKTDSEFINSLNIKDKLIIAPSDIMIGHHISAHNNILTINTILDIVEGDINLMRVSDYCYFIEFKLVPNCNIHGAYDKSEVATFDNPFVTKIGDSKESDIITPNNSKIIL